MAKSLFKIQDVKLIQARLQMAVGNPDIELRFECCMFQADLSLYHALQQLPCKFTRIYKAILDDRDTINELYRKLCQTHTRLATPIHL